MLYSAALVQHSTRATLNKLEDRWLANGDTHRQPPATYGKPESKPQPRSPLHPSRQTSFLTPYCAIHGELSPAAPPPPAPIGPLGFLGHLNGISLKIENVGHDFSPPLTHITDQTSRYALQRRFIQHSTRAALVEPETDGWRPATPIANHPPHTGPTRAETPAHHRPNEPSDTTTTSPINSALTYTSDGLTHHHSQ